MQKTFQRFLVILLVAGSTTIFLASCKGKIKDSDIQTTITEKMKSMPDLSGLGVTVKEGVVTLTGDVKDEATKTAAETAVKAIAGVKSVVNQVSVSLPVMPDPAPIVTSADEVMSKALTDALKDLPAIKGSVKDGMIALSGEISKVKWTMLKQTLDKLTPKGYDLKGLTIK